MVNIDTQTIDGTAIQAYVISFPQDKMTFKVPVNRATAAGLRNSCRQE